VILYCIVHVAVEFVYKWYIVVRMPSSLGDILDRRVIYCTMLNRRVNVGFQLLNARWILYSNWNALKMSNHFLFIRDEYKTFWNIIIFTARKSKDTHMLFVIELLLLSPETNSIALTLYVAHKQFIPIVYIITIRVTP
jgi:hypothetical protein